MENEQELINKNLDLIHKSKFSFGKYELVDLNGKTSHGGFIKEMVNILDSYNLIIESGSYISLSPFGKKVMTKYGSWKNYLNQESIGEEKEEVRQNKKDFMLNIDSKWNIPSKIIGVLGVVAIFYFGFKDNESNSQENKESIKYQKEQIKDTTNIKELKKEEEPQKQLKDTL